MNQQKILEFCKKKGFLLDREVLDLFNEIKDVDSAKMIIEEVKNQTQQNILTKKVFFENKEVIQRFFSELPEENKKCLEKLKINFGLSIEISKEREIVQNSVEEISEESSRSFLPTGKKGRVKILSSFPKFKKKPEVGDFVKNFRNRFVEMRNCLQNRAELTNLVSIDKVSGERKGISLIGIVSDKKITKNKNILFEIEDLTGKIRVLISKSKAELYEKAEEISLDSVIGFTGSGNREIFFVNNIVFPEAMIFERKKSPEEEFALFIGDLHFGSKRFLKDGFLRFIDYLNNGSEEIKKIKYLFIVGDIVTGIGNYPNQERDLEIGDLEEQFLKLAELLGRIRKDIQIIISPGNHDGVRIMEPQPCFDEKYAWPLYDLENVFITGNPAEVNIGEAEGFSGFDVLTYHGFSLPYYAGNVASLIKKKAMNSPEEIVKYLLKNRHLAVTHASTQYFPFEKDALLIRKTPDIMVSAHTHKSGVAHYNDILVISTSCWEAMTPYQEKFGNTPDHCKVVMFNLKTREVKLLDFEEGEDE